MALLLATSGMVFGEPQQAGKSFSLLDTGLGARAVGLAGAYTALSQDSTAPYWNAAGAMWGRSVELSTMQARLPSDLTLSYISMTWRDRSPTQDNGAWGIYWVNGSIGDIPNVATTDVTDTTDLQPNSFFRYTTHAMGLSYANWLDANLAYGVTATGFHQSFETIDNGQGYGASLTPSLRWMPSPRLVVATTIQDLCNIQFWQTGATEFVIPEWRIGSAYAPIDLALLTVEVRQKLKFGYTPTIYVGGEYRIGFIKIRGGWGDDAVAFGCGLYAGPVDLQYAYSANTETGIGDNHRVSLGVGL